MQFTPAAGRYWQVSLARLQLRPVLHTSLSQQRWPSSPHAAQVLFRQSVNGAVQSTLLPQHAWPAFPHVPPWHPPALQTPWPPGQADPSEMQVVPFWSQQPPLRHTLPGQQTWPGPPHCAQTPLLQARVALPQESFAQQGWPAPPQSAQVLLPAQPRFAAAHRPPPQQGWPAAPQVLQAFPLQPTLGAVQRPPQQA